MQTNYNMESTVPKKRGPKPKYTEEERKDAQRANARKYYNKNKEECVKKQIERHKFQQELARKYKEGKLVEIG